MRRALQFLFALLLAVVVAQEPNFDPSKSPLSGPGTQGSQAADGMLLYVTANDGSGITPPCLSATYYVNFKLTLTNVANASLSQTPVIASCTNGVYLATYIGPQILGVYTLTAGYQYPNNTVIPFLGSPVNVTAAAGSINPPSCVGNPPSSATAGDNVIFNITAYDKYGNVNKTCISENNWKILLSGSGNVYQGSITNCANGLYTAQFNAQETARYTLTVTIFGQNIKNSPFPVVVNPGALDPSSTTVTGDIYSAVAGVNALLQITARDKFGNALNSCDPPPFSNWSISFNGALNISGSFDSCKSGIYNAHYMATVAKTYTYSLTYNGANIAKSPYTTVVVANSAISATNSYPSGNPLGSAIAGQTKQYQINVFDAYGNAIHECVGSESTWTFTMALTSDPNTKCTTEPQFSNCFPDDGYFTVLYTCELAGNYTLTNYYNNQIIKNGQFPVRVMPGPIAPQQCKASGSGLQQARAGVETYFEIETFDQYNNKISLCELSPFTNWRATLSLGGYSFLANVLACNNGVYTFEYVLNMTGTWTLIVYYDNQFVVQPFWQVEVVPGPPAPGGCVAFGDGLVGTLAGVAAGFAVTCVDQFANPINDCGYYNKSLWNPLFVLQGSSYNFSGLFVSCTEGSSKATPATTNFTYSNTKAGTYDLTIYYGSTIATRTYNPVIHAGPFDPLHSYAEGPGVESQSLVAGDQTDFSIIAADSYGNKLDTCSMDISKITVAFNPNVTAFNITGCTLGVTDAVYTPTRAGNLSVIIQYNGRNIQGDPYYPYVIAGPTDAAYTVARGDSLVRGVAGNTQYFQIQAYDRFNNPAACVETSNFVVTMTLNSQTVSGVVANCSNGLYIAYYIVTVAAVWELDITYQGTPIQSNPWHPNIVAGSVDAKTCVATPSTLNLQAGQAGDFSITCGDSYNNPVKSCFISSFAFTNGSITKIANCTQGVYTATSSSITAGTYVQTITFNSVPISNQVTIIIVPGPVSNANSYLSALSTYPVGQLSYYYVYPLDQYNNPIYDCDIPFDTAINGTTTVSSNKDSCDGAKYTYVFNVTVVGSYKIYVNYGSSGIKNSPASFNAVAGPISPANSNLTVDANITAGTSGAFTVYAYDAFGNKIQSCANYSNWVITILEEPNNNNGVVQRCSSGIYNGIIIPYRAGIENLRVTIDGLDVGGQGHTAQYTVYAAAPAANTSIAHPVDGSVGNRTTWSIEAYDAFGNQVLNCVTGTNFVVSLKNDQHSCPGTSDCSNGNYSGHYTCNFAGTFDVLVTLNNQNVTTIPPQVNVVAGGPDDSKTKAYGPGVSPQPAIKAGESTYFVIVAQDSFGNQASYCPDYPYTFNFSADPVFIQSPVQVCSAPGNTTVTYTATRAGNYNINIYGKAQIAGGPYSINIVAGPFDPTHITNASVIYQSGSVGQIFVVPLVVRDQYNNTIPGCSKDEVNNFTVTFDASDSDHRYNGHVNCENNQYVVYYQANHTDVYTLTVLYDGQHVEFSPFPDVKIGYGDPDFSKAYATGPGVEAVRTPAGVYDDFTVFLVNKYGYNIISCYPDPAKRFVWTIKITSPSVTAEFVGCFENGENPAGYNFRFNATVATKYKVDISINNTVIANNANYYALIVPGPIYPPYTHVDVPYNTSVVPYDGYFYIIAEDRFHNPVQNLDGLFDAYLAPLCANTTVHCSANNTEKEVNCTYTVAYGGIYCIDIIYNEAEYLFFASYPGLEVTEVVHTGINLNIIGGSACSDGCNNQGVCTKPNVCSCWTNRTGDACEFTHSSKYMKLGLAIGLIIGLAIAFFIIGILIGYCIFKYLNRGSNSEVPLLH